MDVHLRRLAAAQADVVAVWQLIAHGWTRSAIEHHAKRAGWRMVHPGVYALTRAALTPLQSWMAAALTAPHTYLSDLLETVTRAGSGGPRRLGAVLVRRSTQLAGETTACHGIPITNPVRTLIDISASLPERAVGRAFREALRLRVLTTGDVARGLIRHRGRRGTRVLRDLTDRYSSLPYSRTRSNAEARGLEILHGAGIAQPKVNLRVGREEADFAWPDKRLIIEIDGPQYHRFRDEDTRKQRVWETAGYTVRRISSDDVYENPDALITLARGERP